MSRRIINIHGHLHADSDVDRLVEAWRNEGVVKFCALALGRRWQEVGYLGNEGVLRWAEKYPDLLVPMGSIELGVDLDSVDKVEELHRQGFQGLKFISPSRAYSDEAYFGFYEKASELGMPILFHTGYLEAIHRGARPESDIDSAHMRPYHLDVVCRRFPELKVIGAHLGAPHENEAICMAMKYGNIFFDFTGSGGSRSKVSELKRVLAPFPGADLDDPEENLAKQYFKKFVFGTDNPPIATWVANAEEIMDYLHIEEETRQDFYWRNAARLFHWKFE